MTKMKMPGTAGYRPCIAVIKLAAIKPWLRAYESTVYPPARVIPSMRRVGALVP